MAPFVTGEVNPATLDDLVRLCVDLDRLRRHGASGTGSDRTGNGDDGTGGGQGTPGPDTTRAWDAIEQAIIGKAVDLLSGPGGLASFLRRRQLGARLGGPSLPLDIGYSETIPAGIRNAVILRDKHCQWASRCDQPAAACQVHHVTHKANGGKTSVRDCVLLCWFRLGVGFLLNASRSRLLTNGLVLVLAVLYIYVSANVAVAFYYLRFRRHEFNWFLHIALPVVSTAALIYVTIKSFQPFPSFPYNYAPLIDGTWLAIGLIILGVLWLRKKDDWLTKAGAASVDADVIPEIDDTPAGGRVL